MQQIRREFLTFLMFGVLNTAVGYSLFLLFNQGLGLYILVANALSYAIGVMLAYLSSRFVVFRADPARGHRIGPFLVAFLIAFGANQGVLLAFKLGTGLHDAVIQLFGMATYTVTFFLLNKFVVFRPAAG